MKAIYMDVCALGRPFDEQHFPRILLETEAYRSIIRAIEGAKYTLVVSPVHLSELKVIRDTDEGRDILELLHRFGIPAKCDENAVAQRTIALIRMGFGKADAAHVAFAEASADFFITCDDRLLRKCRREKVSVRTFYPQEFTRLEDLK